LAALLAEAVLLERPVTAASAVWAEQASPELVDSTRPTVGAAPVEALAVRRQVR